ncbi:MAG: hypothetical protein H0T18_06290, partial [Chloroflexia bacterium]|nr:hypothetical protein [Chloroflexia bacterium]
SWWGLDGLAYGEVKSPGDVAAIRWLSGNVEPGDILLEAAGCSYHPFGCLPFNRISAFTGIPTAIGWDNHERQWRAGQPEALEQIARRQEDVASMMADPESGLFEKYGITWLIVGDYEVGNWRSECPTAGPYATLNRSALPGASWDEVFASDQTRIYRRRDS